MSVSDKLGECEKGSSHSDELNVPKFTIKRFFRSHRRKVFFDKLLSHLAEPPLFPFMFFESASTHSAANTHSTTRKGAASFLLEVRKERVKQDGI